MNEITISKYASGTLEEVNKNRYIILIIVLMGVFMSVVDTNVVNVALPTITNYFQVDIAQSQWVVTSYLIFITCFLLIFGRVSEYTGKTKLFMAGIAIFTISSLGCGISGNIYYLIFFRIIQGLGAAVVFSIDMAIIVQAFPSYERGKALGFLVMTIAFGSIAGPILGGLVIDTLGWKYIFFINIPVGITSLALALKYLKINEVKCKCLKIDWISSTSLVLSLITLILVLGDISAYKGIVNNTWIYIGVFSISFAGFIYSGLTRKDPIIDLSFFRVKKFTFSNISCIINYMTFSMFNMVMPFYLQMVLGYRPSQVGQVLIAIPAVMAIAAPISGWLYDKYHTNYHSSLGMLLMAIALFIIGYYASSMAFALLIVCFIIYGFGNGLFVSTNNSEGLSSLPQNKNSTASSMLAMMRNLGNTIGVSLASILLYYSVISSGFYGDIISADPALLSYAISSVLMVAGTLCMAGVLSSMLIRWK